MTAFNLVDEPWLPCRMKNGSSRNVSLRETLLQAHSIEEMFDPAPPVTAALHRLLLAVLHRSLDGPRDMDRWAALWRVGRFDETVVGGYLTDQLPRFDLFDSAHPFYQRADLNDAGDVTIQRLQIDASTGSNPTLFDHSRGDRPDALTAAAAARALVATQSYAMGGGVSRPFNLCDAQLTRGFVVQAAGRSLFETLLLNLLPYTGDSPLPRLGDDLPAWEQNKPPAPDQHGTPLAGYVDYLTYQSRRILLLRDDDGLLRRCRIQQNLKLPEGPLDPFKPYLRDKESGYRPLLLNRDKAVWRDSHVLLEEAGDEARRPLLFDHLARVNELRREGEIEAQSAIDFDVLGLSTEPGRQVVYLWRHERLPLPLEYLRERRLLEALNRGIVRAAEVGRDLGSAAWTLASFLIAPGHDQPGASQPDRKAVEALTRSFGHELRYWARLDEPFRRLLLRLPEDRFDDPDEGVVWGRNELPEWRTTLRTQARQALEEVMFGLGMSPRTIKPVTQADRRLSFLLGKTLGNPRRVDAAAVGGRT